MMYVNQARDSRLVIRTWAKTNWALKEIKADNVMDLRKR